MIASVHITGIGPYRDETFRIPKALEPWDVVGCSESGKTVLMDCVVWCLWGKTSANKAFNVDLIRSDYDMGTVEITLANNAILSRSIGRSRQTKMIVKKPSGETLVAKSEDQWREIIGPFGKNPEAFRFIVSPQWQNLPALLSGNCRAFRDMLLSPTSGSKPVRFYIDKLLQEEGQMPLQDYEPEHIKKSRHEPTDGAEERVTAANAVFTEKSATARTLFGQWQKRVAEWKAVLQASVTEDQAKKAKGDVLSYEEWTAYETQVENWRLRVKAFEDASKAIVGWKIRRDQIGEAPCDPNEAKAAEAIWTSKGQEIQREATSILEKGARVKAILENQERAWSDGNAYVDPKIAATEVKVAAIRSTVADLDKEIEEVEKELETTPRTVKGCPTCGNEAYEGINGSWRPLNARIEKLREKRVNLVKQMDDLEAEKMTLAEKEQTEAERRRDAATASFKQAETERTTLLAKYEELRKALTEANANIKRSTDDLAAYRVWKASIDALGPEPTPGEEPRKPSPPKTERVNETDYKQAKATVAMAEKIATETSIIEADMRRLEGESKEADTEKDAAEKAKTRAAAVLSAVRRAPSEKAKDMAKFYSGLGDVEIRFPDVDKAEDASVELKILDNEGTFRDWEVASTGKRILADYLIRRRMAELANAVWLPVFIDMSNLRGINTWPPFTVSTGKRHPAVRLVTDEECKQTVVRQ